MRFKCIAYYSFAVVVATVKRGFCGDFIRLSRRPIRFPDSCIADPYISKINIKILLKPWTKQSPPEISLYIREITEKTE